MRAELEVLGLDASRHVVDFYRPFLAALGAVPAGELLTCRSGAEVLVAGVKVATQTPPIRSGRRVVFVTLDDGTGCTDSTFFEDAQGPYAATVFHSWLLVIRGVLRRTGPRGVSLRATGAWELPALHEAWEADGLDGVRELMAAPGEYTEQAIAGAAASPELAAGHGAAGAGPPDRLPDVALRRHQAGRGRRRDRGPPRGVRPAPQALALQPRQLRPLSTAGRAGVPEGGLRDSSLVMTRAALLPGVVVGALSRRYLPADFRPAAVLAVSSASAVVVLVRSLMG